MTPDTAAPVPRRADEPLRVASGTPPAELATAVSRALADGRHPVLRAIGAGAVNQAVKAIAIASSQVALRGLVLSCRPGFVNGKIDDQDRTIIVFHVWTTEV